MVMSAVNYMNQLKARAPKRAVRQRSFTAVGRLTLRPVRICGGQSVTGLGLLSSSSLFSSEYYSTRAPCSLILSFFTDALCP